MAPPSTLAAPRPGRSRLGVLVRDLGAVLLTWALLVGCEFVVVGASCRALFAGNWELIEGRKLVGPIALAMLVPAAGVTVALGHLVARAASSARARQLLGAVGGVVATAVAVGVTHGRHFASLSLRAPFVVAVALAGCALAYALPSASLAFGGRARRIAAIVAGTVGAGLAWVVDARVLPRLYPAFHSFVFGLLLAFAALTVLAWRSPATVRVPRSELLVGAVGLLAAACSVAWAPFAARRLTRSDNLRIVLEEHAPLLGRAVHLAAWLAPPTETDVASGGIALPPLDVPRALDWTGDDILLISIDALRADHVSAYGYTRATTPNIDALAKEGAVFEHAYCPTPHTSYSVTSLMTGKAMRPLLALGLAKESETWATYLRRYGYKTAAFYPPAVFYIDEPRFTTFEESGLGFEYRWVEFTTAEEKVKEVERYLATAGPEPLFLWVHLFEPHEPYVMHPSHPFEGGSSRAIDAYDSEVAYADAAVGELVRIVRGKRPKVSIIVTADHGEEFGEHGGRYHGTTCYEEQVRVPLVVAAPGVTPRRVAAVAQTIDLLPTVLSALGIPRPARVRGRDLGPLLATGGGGAAKDDLGLAYAETDEQTLVARGDDRLVCARSIAACALYDVSRDPAERIDRAAEAPAVARELRALTAGIEREQGRYEVAEVVWPDALRRGLQGEVESAADVAALLDDANVTIRREAARVTFKLAAPAVAPEARRALLRDEDDVVRRWVALALVRMGEPPAALADALLRDADVKWRRVAALAFALRGDGRGKAELAVFWADEAPPNPGLDMVEAKELLSALANVRDADAVPGLVRSLDYVPLRARVADALGVIGDARAVKPLLARLDTERDESARSHEARALAAMGGGRELLPRLAFLAGLPDPMLDAIEIARAGKLLERAKGGVAFEPPVADVDERVSVAAGVPLRLWVLAASAAGTLSGDVGGDTLSLLASTDAVFSVDVEARPDAAGRPVELRLRLHEAHGIAAVWVVPRTRALVPSANAGQPDASPARGDGAAQ